MSEVKKHIKGIIDSLPEDATYEEILRELFFHRMIKRGEKDAREGNTISNEEMRERIEEWKDLDTPSSG